MHTPSRRQGESRSSHSPSHRHPSPVTSSHRLDLKKLHKSADTSTHDHLYLIPGAAQTLASQPLHLSNDDVTKNNPKSQNPESDKKQSDSDAVSDVPDPIPENNPETTAVHSSLPNIADRLTTAASGSSSPFLQSITGSAASLVSFQHSTTIPILPSSNDVSPTSQLRTASSTLRALASAPVSSISSPASSTPTPIHIAPVVMIVIGIGTGLVISGLFMLIKSCTRPRKRAHPIPSRPVLQEAYCDPFIQDSPLFGGRERLSALEKTNALKDNKPTPWTQYYYPSLPPTIEPENAMPVSHFSATTTGVCNPYAVQQDFANQLTTQAATEATLSGKMTENRYVSRLSAGSVSIYPSTPNSAQMGLALEGEAAFKAQILSPDPRALKSPTSPLVKSSTFAGQPTQKLKKSRPISEAFAYDGADVLSPKPTQQSLSAMTKTANDVTAPPSSAQVGRTRIRSTYFEKYPRGFSIHAGNSAQNGKSIIEDQSAIPRKPSVQPPFLATTRSSEYDAQALTQAMGLSSPTITATPTSPQTTIYPDDSMSVAHRSVKPSDSMRMKSSRKPVPKRTDVNNRHVRDTHGVSASALGEFMLADDTSPTGSSSSAGIHSPEPIIEHGSSQLVTVARPTMVTVGNNANGGGKEWEQRAGKKVAITRDAGNDVPPRVPSPPLLPSLAQMAMEQSNPVAYEDYRSPTYSLYGLYQDRKSQMYAPGGH